MGTWESKQRKGQKGRLDHCLVLPNLIKHTKYINHTSIGEHLSDHRAIEVIFDWAKVKRGKGIFRAQKGLEKNISYQEIIKTTIKTCLIEHLEDDLAREYLTGKIDNLNKLEKTRDNLKKNNNDEVSEITSASIITLEDEINRLSDELPDNLSLLKKIKKTKYSNILEYVLFQLQRATINFTKNNKIEENDTRNEVVSELDDALNEEANGIDNHELIQELQNR